jgi:hypothetical protein
MMDRRAKSKATATKKAFLKSVWFDGTLAFYYFLANTYVGITAENCFRSLVLIGSAVVELFAFFKRRNAPCQHAPRQFLAALLVASTKPARTVSLAGLSP